MGHDQRLMRRSPIETTIRYVDPGEKSKPAVVGAVRAIPRGTKKRTTIPRRKTARQATCEAIWK